MKLNSIVLITLATLGCTVATMAQNLPSYIPANGLVGWWPFNGNANDESGNGNNGTVNGAVLSQDRFGIANQSYNFNGPNNNITVPNSNSLNIVSNQITISFWVNYQNINDGQIKGICKGGYGIGSGYEVMLDFRPTSGGPYIAFNGGGGSAAITPFNNYAASWAHVLAVFSPTSGGEIYINGVLQSSWTGGMQITGFNANSNNLIFGSRTPGQAYVGYLYGMLDDIAIWNRALTQQEITALYTASSTNTNEAANTIITVPSAISYQAVARDAQGTPLANANLEVQFSLLADSLTGAAEYTETHSLTTNEFGLFTTAFGAGTSVSGTFSSINWSAGNKYLHVQMDTGGGWVDMGTQQLLATPYSMHSATSGAIKNPGLPVFSDNAAASAGGLSVGEMYRTAGGVLMVVY
jgi:hypothetical protein